MQTMKTTSPAGSQAPAYVASRVAEGAALPEVEMNRIRGRARAVARHALEGLQGKLVREVMELAAI
jgi:hypothetical protein